jgi:RNA polymerase sigma-70 factor (ECF subfamily)
MLEDHRLFKRLQGGDRNALCSIYEKYIDDLLAVAVSLLYDIHAAEDCLHDVFVKFAASASTINIRISLKGYLMRCVANRAKDILRKKQRRANSPLEQASTEAEFNDPIAQLVTSEQSARILHALNILPAEQREVFVLRVQAEMKFSQIAIHTGQSVNTVRSRYRYAVKRIRMFLEKGGRS